MDCFANHHVDQPTIDHVQEYQPIGGILIRHNKLTPDRVDQIVEKQKSLHLAFGQAAIELGFIQLADLELALSEQFGYPRLDASHGDFAPELVAAHAPDSEEAEAFRRLRTQLLHSWFSQKRQCKLLAVASSSRGDGRSYVTANVAISFAQLGKSTLVIDADLRNPRQHALFNLSNGAGLSTLLNGMSGSETIHGMDALHHLAILPSGPRPPNPQELLSRNTFTELLRTVGAEFDVVLIDTPAHVVGAEVQTVASEAGGAIVVAHVDKTPQKPHNELMKSLHWARVEVIGAVMNNRYG